MVLWRLTPRRHRQTALSGVGAAIAGGRWNSPGRRAVYLSEDAGTTVLETLTTFSRASAPAEGYLLLRCEYDGSSRRLGPADLPVGWNQPDDTTVARRIGDGFLDALDGGLLLVPSVPLPVAWNGVLNPLHPDAARLRVVAETEFSFDARWPLR